MPYNILQPGLLPVYKWILKKKFDFKNKPDIIITCGRKSVYLSLLLKKIYKENIITIHIQNSKVNIKNFDFIISPNHDGITGSNVINSIGAIHHFRKENIEHCKIADKNISNILSYRYKEKLELFANQVDRTFPEQIRDEFLKCTNVKTQLRYFHQSMGWEKHTSEDKFVSYHFLWKEPLSYEGGD